MTRIVAILVMIALAACSGVQRPPEGDRVELVEHLASLAPKIDSRATNLRSFTFNGRLSGGFEIQIRCFFEAPSAKACAWLHDGLPVFVAAGDRILTYNPLDGPLLWQADWSVEFAFRTSAQALDSSVSYGVYNLGSDHAGVKIDLTQIVATAPLRRSVVSRGNERFTLSGSRENEGRFEAWIDLARPLAYTRVLSTGKTRSGASTLVEVEGLTANEPIPAEAFRFPRFEEEITLPPVISLTLDNMGEAITKAMREFLLRMGMKDPSQRPELEAKLGRKVEWHMLHERDATVGQKLGIAIERHFQSITRAMPTAGAPLPPIVRGEDGAEMMLVPAGEFRMGSQEFEEERPEHRVFLDGFYNDKYEVTNALYLRFVRATGRSAPAFWQSRWGIAPDEPVVGVTWSDAKAYCQWAGKRLPTEAEREKAARGTDGRAYPWGDQWHPQSANFYGAELGRTVAVGSYPRGVSPYGVHDMAGNVSEWVADWYDKTYYQRSPARNPQGPDGGELKVVRGGSQRDSPIGVRSARRSHFAPDTRYDQIGFRCAKPGQVSTATAEPTAAA